MIWTWISGLLRKKPLKEVIQEQPAPEEQKPKVAYMCDIHGNKVATRSDYIAMVSPTTLQANLALVYAESLNSGAQFKFLAVKSMSRGTDAETKAGMIASSHWLLGSPAFKPTVDPKSARAPMIRIPLNKLLFPEVINEALEFVASLGYSCDDEDIAALLIFYDQQIKRELAAMFRKEKGARLCYVFELTFPHPQGKKANRKVRNPVTASVYFANAFPDNYGDFPVGTQAGASITIPLTSTRRGENGEEMPAKLIKTKPRQDPPEPEVEMK